jgi:hypothetical protein
MSPQLMNIGMTTQYACAQTMPNKTVIHMHSGPFSRRNWSFELFPDPGVNLTRRPTMEGDRRLTRNWRYRHSKLLEMSCEFMSVLARRGDGHCGKRKWTQEADSDWKERKCGTVGRFDELANHTRRDSLRALLGLSCRGGRGLQSTSCILGQYIGFPLALLATG